MWPFSSHLSSRLATHCALAFWQTVKAPPLQLSLCGPAHPTVLISWTAFSSLFRLLPQSQQCSFSHWSFAHVSLLLGTWYYTCSHNGIFSLISFAVCFLLWHYTWISIVKLCGKNLAILTNANNPLTLKVDAAFHYLGWQQLQASTWGIWEVLGENWRVSAATVAGI